MRDLTNVEYEILNALYFVEPYQKILEEVDFPRNIVNDSLKFLIEHKMVCAMSYDEVKKGFKRSYMYDGDNLKLYHFLATKEGLMAHTMK